MDIKAQLEQYYEQIINYDKLTTPALLGTAAAIGVGYM